MSQQPYTQYSLLAENCNCLIAIFVRVFPLSQMCLTDSPILICLHNLPIRRQNCYIPNITDCINNRTHAVWVAPITVTGMLSKRRKAPFLVSCTAWKSTDWKKRRKNPLEIFACLFSKNDTHICIYTQAFTLGNEYTLYHPVKKISMNIVVLSKGKMNKLLNYK